MPALIEAGAEVNSWSNLNYPLRSATGYGYVEILNAWFAAHADVNTVNENGRTLVHRRARDGHTEIVKALIAAGAEVDSEDNAVETPLP